MDKKGLRIKIAYLFIALMLATLSFMVACKSQPASTTPAATTPAATTPAATTPAKQPQYGGVLKIISPVGPSVLGWKTMRSHPDHMLTEPCLESLFIKDTNTQPVPQLATSWEFSSDMLSITFHLRQGVKFHDGTDFNAEAVKYNVDLYKSTSPNQPEAKQVTSAVVVDNYTVRLTLAQVDSTLLSGQTLMYVCRIASPAALAKGQDYCLTNPVGTGPFKFVSFERDVSLKYARFDGYWDKGKPYLDGIEFKFISDPMVAKAAFMAGEADVMEEISNTVASDLQKTGKYIVRSAPSVVVGLAGDSANPDSPFADVRVRQAVSYAINNEDIANAVGKGLYEATDQIAANKMWFYNPQVVGYPYDPAKAKNLLNEAGYPKGFTTTIMFQSGNSEYQDCFTMVQSYLSKVGIDAKLQAVDNAKYMNYLLVEGWKNGMILFRPHIGVDYDILASMRDQLISTAALMKPTFYHEGEIDAKVFAALKEYDYAKRKALIFDAEKLLIDKYCSIIPIYVGDDFTAMNTKVQDLDIIVPMSAFWTPAKAWLSK